MKITTEVRGLPELLANIRSLGTAFSGEVEEKALKAAAKPLKEGIAARIDADHHRSGLTAADIGFAVSKEAKSEGAAAVLVGAHKKRAFILNFLEFGTYGRPGFHIVATEFRQHAPGFVAEMTKQLAASFARTRSKFLRRAA